MSVEVIKTEEVKVVAGQVRLLEDGKVVAVIQADRVAIIDEPEKDGA